MTSEIRGQLERVTYTNEENGYTVARVRMDGHPELVTVVGNLLSPVPGEVLQMQGEWVEHPRFGRQFKIEHSRSVFPASAYGIQKYLGSGLVRGIGPALAKRIVARFGERTLEVIEERIEALAEVEGIGEKRIAMIGRAWEEQKEIREVMVFLQAHEVSAAYAARIFKRYGQRSIEVVRQNPYRLSADIFGVGFLTADRIAARLGFAPDSPLRAEAGILHVLQKLADEGHVYCPHEPLVERCREVLAIDAAVVLQALEGAERDRRVVVDDLHSAPGESLGNDKGVYLAQFHVCECGIAESFGRLLAAPRAIREIDAPKAIEWVQRRLAIRLADRQRDAVGCALTSKVMVITGGPGTGKTTIIHAILEIVTQLRVRILLAAPTGRAAKRMTEATGREARTIHRLLEYSLQKGGFQRNSDRPLECDLLIVDEASMMDTVLFHHLLKALPAGAALILVGDVNQLPSVGAGNVLGDIIASATVPVIELTEIFRQARESLIVMNAHRINAGRMPELKPAGPSGDFYFIEQEDPEEVLKLVLELAGERVPRHFDLDPLDGVQVLTPMHRGTVGAANLNARLQETLNPGPEGLVRGARQFRLNDKVMQIRNNYDKDVFNGDIGRITGIELEGQEVTVAFDGREVPYDFGDLDEIVLAYAVSVHKSQGSEYPAVILPLLTQHYLLLQRNLLYTAVTRGKRLVVIVGSRKAVALCVQNNRTEHRYTRLKERLRRART